MIGLTDTTLRDAHQSLWATRLRTEEIVPVLKDLDNIGYHSVEVWGGAIFDVCLRYLNEDPWERLRTIKKTVTKTPLQMLVRGQNLVGYKHYADDLVEKFIEKSIKNGIDIIRTFDAINDTRNLEKVIEVTKKNGAHIQGSLVYTISPIHKLQDNIDLAKRLCDLGVNSICVKDMAGLMTPGVAYKLIKKLKKEIDVPIQLHSHCTSGLATLSYLKAIEAGVDILDTAVASMALHTSQPSSEVIVTAASSINKKINMDLDLMNKVSRYFENIEKEKGYKRPKQGLVDIGVLKHQVPGGMISNLQFQLEQQKAGHRILEVLEELPNVRKDLGYPPLVTPTSQFLGTQAVLNVLLGERYKIIPQEVENYCKGLYGKPPGRISKELLQKVLKGGKPKSGRPADYIEPAMPKIKKEVPKKYIRQEEDYLSYGIFPAIAMKFFRAREEGANNSEEDNIHIEIAKIRSLAKSLDENDLSELTLETDNDSLILRKKK